MVFTKLARSPTLVLEFFCALYIRRIAINDENRGKRKDFRAYVLVECYYLETPA